MNIDLYITTQNAHNEVYVRHKRFEKVVLVFFLRISTIKVDHYINIWLWERVPSYFFFFLILGREKTFFSSMFEMNDFQ